MVATKQQNGTQRKELPAKPTAMSKADRLPPIVRTHDIFNLVALAALNVLNIGYIAGYISGAVLLFSSLSYFIVDAGFVGLFPRCVRSPEVILTHHLVAIALIFIPLRYPRYTWCLAYCMLVEVNTWLLIAKRTWSFPALEGLFLVTWVLLRNIWYPILIGVFYREWRLETAAVGTPWNPIIITPIFQTILTGLNVHWSIALFKKKREDRPKHL